MLKATGANCLLNDGGPGDLQFLKVLFAEEREREKKISYNKQKQNKKKNLMSCLQSTRRELEVDFSHAFVHLHRSAPLMRGITLARKVKS